MKYITKRDVEKLDLTKKRGQHPENPVVTIAMKLKIGEFLLVEKKDWKIKSYINQALRDSSPARKVRAKFKVKTLSNNTGWIVERIN
jgi:hypothetical protein